MDQCTHIRETRGRKKTFSGNTAAVEQVLLAFARERLNAKDRLRRFVVYCTDRDCRADVAKVKDHVALVNESGAWSAFGAGGCLCEQSVDTAVAPPA